MLELECMIFYKYKHKNTQKESKGCSGAKIEYINSSSEEPTFNGFNCTKSYDIYKMCIQTHAVIHPYYT